jgi:hypothetical protein
MKFGKNYANIWIGNILPCLIDILGFEFSVFGFQVFLFQGGYEDICENFYVRRYKNLCL